MRRLPGVHPRSWAVGLAVVAGALAHGSRGNPALAAPPPSFDLQAVMRRAHFSFRAAEGGFEGGHSTYGIDVRGGGVRVRPIAARPPQGAASASPLVLETTGIGRESNELLTVGAPTIDASGRLVRRGPAVEEALENTDEGVEWSWRLPVRPGGQGDLVVRVAAGGLAYAGGTGSGLHFLDPASSLGIRLGQAVWVDADGRRTDVPVGWNGREIELRVPRAVVEASSYPAVLDPLLGPELAVDAPLVGSASGRQESATTAYDAGSGRSLVAWVDDRASSVAQVFCTVLGPSGAVLNPEGIPLSLLDTSVSDAFAVFDGENFLVVYLSGNVILARRVNPEGKVLDSVPFTVNDNAAPKRSLAAASDGKETLVAWEDDRNAATTGTDVLGARIQGSKVLNVVGKEVGISMAGGRQGEPRVTFGAGNWLVAWSDMRSGTNTDIYAARVSPTGSVLDPAGIPISTAAGAKAAPWPASDGLAYFVVWEDDRNANPDIYGARVTAGGVVADPGGLVICGDPNGQTQASVAFAGANYQVVWEDTRFGLYGNRVVPSTGAALDGPTGASIAGAVGPYASQPRTFAAGTGSYVTWGARPANDSDGDLYGSRLSSGGSLLDAPGLVLAQSANGEHDPAVASDGTNYLVAWRDDRGSSSHIFAARVDGATGLSLDPAGILVSPGDLGVDGPAVAFNGSQYLVVWKEQGPPAGIYGTRISTAGTIVGSARTALFVGPTNQPGSDVSVASDGTGWLVAWEDSRNFALSTYDIYAGRVSAAGAPLDPSGIPVSTDPQFQFTPRVAYGGGFYLITWWDGRPVSHGDLYGARLTSAGVVQEPSGIAISTGTGDVNTGSYHAAYVAPNFVVAYTRSQLLSRARIAATTGAVVDTAALGPCCVTTLAIAYDLDSVLIVYDFSLGPASFVGGTRLSAAGVDLDPTDWQVATGANRDLALAALTGSPGKALLTYSRYDAKSGVTSDRVVTRLLTHAQSELSLTNTDGHATAVPGGPVAYTITATNGGPDVAIGATVTDTVPGTIGAVTWTCVGTGGGACPAGGSGSLAQAVDIPMGGSVTFTLSGTISPSATGSLANTATVSAPAGWTEVNTANNGATDTDTLTPQADLSITKTDGRSTTAPGAPIEYTIVAQNAGPSAVASATVTDAVPAGTTLVSWTCTGTGGATCAASGAGSINETVGLTAAGSVTFTLTGHVSPSAAGSWSNTATVSVPGGVTDPAPGNNSATDVDTVVPANDTPAHAKPVLVGSISRDQIGPPPDDQDWFRFSVKAGRSFCVEVDNGESDTSERDPILDVYRADGTTLVGTSDDIADEPGGGRLSRVCYIATASEDNLARVTGGTHGSPGGIRVRVVETTLFCPWFGPLFAGSGFESFILIKNTTGTAHAAAVMLSGTGGASLAPPQSGTVPANGSYNLQVSAASPAGFGLAGASGSLFIAHDGPPGSMIANVTTLNFGSGVSYDTPAVPRQDFRP